MKKAQIALYTACLLLMTSVNACSKGSAGNQPLTPRADTIDVPAFSADSAYSYVASQVVFGPRIANSVAHEKCAKWLASELNRHGADTVILQNTNLNDFGPMTNIMGRFGLNKSNRILLLAHWDSRPTADEETDPALRSLPIDGANDGASGVGVLLEIARLIGKNSPKTGVDILFVDAEDAGNEGDEDSWARGAQYFAENMPYGTTEPLPHFAVLLDMVGGHDAKFPREMFSEVKCRQFVDKIWKLAKENDLAERFPNRTGGAINDDHVPLMRAGIPAVDIIESNHPLTGSFNPTWHTLNDNLENIDRNTLGDVGKLVTLLIYSE